MSISRTGLNILKYAGKTVAWAVAIPVLLVMIVSVLIYVPPVQQYAVDKAAEMLSEEMGMDVRVDRVRLKFPLDLSLGGVTMIQEADTVLDAGELVLRVKPLPLFQANVEVDEVTIRDAKVNTLGLIDACTIKGGIGELYLDSHYTDLASDTLLLSRLRLSDSDMTIVLADSVPEDTTETEPVEWKVKMDDATLHNVSLTLMLPPSSDSIKVNAYLADAHTRALLDLKESNYFVTDFSASRSIVNYDIGGGPRLRGFDAEHLNFYDMQAEFDSLSYLNTGNLYVKIRQFAAHEKCGLDLRRCHGVFAMDTTALHLVGIDAETSESRARINFDMDLTAFNFHDPGTFSIDASGTVGKQDIMLFTADFTQQFAQAYPPQPTKCSLSAHGNLERLNIEHLHAFSEGNYSIDASGFLTNLRGDPMDMDTKLEVDAKVANTAFITRFMPAEATKSFYMPRSLAFNGNLSKIGQQLETNARINIESTQLIVDGGCNLADESYNVKATAHQLTVGKFVPIGQNIRITGSVDARGRGFNFDSASTWIEAQAKLSDAVFDQMNLSNSAARLKYSGGKVDAHLTCDNRQLQTDLSVNGSVNTKRADATIDIALPFVDVKAMGMSDEPLQIRTDGLFRVYTNYGALFKVDAKADYMHLVMGSDTIDTESFDLFAESLLDSTVATLYTGDLEFDFHAPYHILKFTQKCNNFLTNAKRQFKAHDANLDKLKAYLPEATLVARLGAENPLAKILRAKGMRYSEMQADFKTSPVDGVVGNAHVYNFRTDSIRVDTAFVDIRQDSDRINIRSMVALDDQPLCDGFSAYLNGYLQPSLVDVKLVYLNKQGKKGIDLGVRAEANDSLIDFHFYPKRPIIAYREFEVNDDNYLKLLPSNKIFADINLKSTTDRTYIGITANPRPDEEQNIRAMIDDLNLKELMSVIPFAPNIAGLLDLDANYVQKNGQYTVDGKMRSHNFSYEDMLMGNVGADFSYEPLGATGHQIDASILHGDTLVAKIDGTYDTAGKGNIDAQVRMMELPLSMASPFIPDNIVYFDGDITGNINVQGPLDRLDIDGELLPHQARVISDMYGFDLRLEDAPIELENSVITLNRHKLYGEGESTLTLNGNVDFSNTDNIGIHMSLYGRNFQLINSVRKKRSLIYGKLFGDFFARATGTTSDLSVRGLVNILNTTNLTYIMQDTPLTIDYRLDDIVTFVDFSRPPDDDFERPVHTFMGIDMQMQVEVEEGARFNCEFSADQQSYVNVKGNGSLVLNYSPEGVLLLQGRYTISSGEMKYTLPVIPLKTFSIQNGSYIEFTGRPMNPTLNIIATERTKANVSDGDTPRSVVFDVGLKISRTLEDMGLEFIIDAPEDMTVQNELAGMSNEEKNKLAVGLLATGMYLSTSNSAAFSASNALNNFLQSEINNIVGKALSSITQVDLNVGLEQTMRDDGTMRTDYSFKFSKRFFSDKLNVVIGGRINADGNAVGMESGAYIDDVSLEWRLDNIGQRYLHVFHKQNYDNLIEGQLQENGAGYVWRKKVDRFADLFKPTKLTAPSFNRPYLRRDSTNMVRRDSLPTVRRDSVPVRQGAVRPEE